MLDMGSKVTYATLNDNLKDKMLFTPKPRFRCRKLFSKIYFLLSQTTNIPAIIFPPTVGDLRVLRIASNVIQVNIERKKKKLVFSFKKQTLLKGTLSQQKNFSVS